MSSKEGVAQPGEKIARQEAAPVGLYLALRHAGRETPP